MSDHLFGSITLPPDLRQLVDIHRFHLDRGAGTASMLDAWRAFLGHLRSTGPMAFVASACEHLEHFGDNADRAVEELIDSPWDDVVSLGLALQSVLHPHGPLRDFDPGGQPAWLLAIESRRAIGASVRQQSPPAGPTPWIVELDFGLETPSCANVWINPDGSLYQLYPTDEPIQDVEAFLGEINDLIPNLPFQRVPPLAAISALRAPNGRGDSRPADKAMLQWLVRTTPAT